MDVSSGSLTTEQVALLIGLVKGPSYYDPRRFPDRALSRRNFVLGKLHENKLIDDAEYMRAQAIAPRCPQRTWPGCSQRRLPSVPRPGTPPSLLTITQKICVAWRRHDRTFYRHVALGTKSLC